MSSFEVENLVFPCNNYRSAMNMYSEHKRLLSESNNPLATTNHYNRRAVHANVSTDFFFYQKKPCTVRLLGFFFSIMPCKTKITTMHPTMPEPGSGGSRVVAWGTAVPPNFFEKYLICILFNNIYMYNILLYIIASLLSLYNNLNTLYSQLFYHRLVI